MAARRQAKELGAGWVRSFADDRSSGQCFFFFFFANFVMLLKWRSSIRPFSQIWRQENMKVSKKSIIIL
jgi:hypothetical protein